MLMDWSGRSGSPPPGLEQAVDRFFLRYAADSGRPIRLAEAISEFITIARENALTLPPDLLLLLRALGTAEGLARTLDPDLDVIAAIAPVVVRAFAARFKPKALAARAFRTFKELDQILAMAPEALRRVIGRVSRDGLVVQVSSSDFTDLPRAMRRAGDTIALGIVVAALLVAVALVTVAQDDQLAALVRVAILLLGGAGLIAFLRRLYRD